MSVAPMKLMYRHCERHANDRIGWPRAWWLALAVGAQRGAVDRRHVPDVPRWQGEAGGVYFGKFCQTWTKP
ncbi:hypothetical protein EMIT0324P_11330 [Pseudomonas chlororaphis]